MEDDESCRRDLNRRVISFTDDVHMTASVLSREARLYRELMRTCGDGCGDILGVELQLAILCVVWKRCQC